MEASTCRGEALQVVRPPCTRVVCRPALPPDCQRAPGLLPPASLPQTESLFAEQNWNFSI